MPQPFTREVAQGLWASYTLGDKILSPLKWDLLAYVLLPSEGYPKVTLIKPHTPLSDGYMATFHSNSCIFCNLQFSSVVRIPFAFILKLDVANYGM